MQVENKCEDQKYTTIIFISFFFCWIDSDIRWTILCTQLCINNYYWLCKMRRSQEADCHCQRKAAAAAAALQKWRLMFYSLTVRWATPLAAGSAGRVECSIHHPPSRHSRHPAKTESPTRSSGDTREPGTLGYIFSSRLSRRLIKGDKM